MGMGLVQAQSLTDGVWLWASSNDLSLGFFLTQHHGGTSPQCGSEASVSDSSAAEHSRWLAYISAHQSVAITIIPLEFVMCKVPKRTESHKERVLRTQGWEVGKVAGGYCFYASYPLLLGAG